MGMLVQNPIGLLVFLLVFVFSLNPQLSFSSSSNVTLPNDSSLMLCHPLQSHALLQFISNFVIETSGLCEESYPKTESWKEDTDCCSSWDGVTCDEVSGHVIGLDLSCSQLVGTIHSNNSLFSSDIAPYLQRLNLAFNDFQGSNMSPQFGVNFGSSLTHLNLSFSFLTGNIPSAISLLSNLVALDVSGNGLRVESQRVLKKMAQNLTHLRVLNLDNVNMSSLLHATFLENLSSSLTCISLNNCQLQGQYPSTFLLLPSLQELYLSGNNIYPNTSLVDFNSTTPISSNLWFLDLSYTSFSIPSSVGFLDFVGNHLTSLRHLNLRGCNISGSIPPSFGNLTRLTHLNLGINHLSGHIPASLGNLVELIDLYLYSNHLNGSIPTSFSNLTHLVSLGMGDNELEGTLPSYLFAFPYSNYIDLSDNNLHGQIPTSPVKSINLTHLDLSNNNLNDSLDFHVFFNLRKLQHLDLSNNNISSTDSNLSYSLPSLEYLDLSSCSLDQFPTFFKSLTNLTRLIVSNNQIQGSVPDWIYDVGEYTLILIDISGNLLTSISHQVHWKNIEFIDFHSNLLQGPLPISPTTTSFFSVSNNFLSGDISSSICDLSHLEVFDLSHNHFAGLIPQCLGSVSKLSVLNLGRNKLHGVIPDTFAKNNNLNSLVLKGNQLTGSLPPSLAYCDNLQMLDVGNNMIEDTMPYWLEKLSSLEVLVLRSNKFFGSLNNFKADIFFPNLRILDLSNNDFTGQLQVKLIRNLNAMMRVDEKLEDGNWYMKPSPNVVGEVYYSMVIIVKGVEMEYVKILTTLATIDLSKNRFEGHIPEVIGKLVSLKGLNLSQNLLTGHIPSAIGNLVSLEWLDLSSNKLSGQIPRQLVDITSLSVLNFSHNQLGGPIPQGNQFNTFTNDSYKDNLALCGFPLLRLCGLNHEPPSVHHVNKDSPDSESGFSWKVAFAGYGCGIVLGLSMGYIVFETGTPKWFVRMVDGKKQRGRVGQRSRRSGGRRRN